MPIHTNHTVQHGTTRRSVFAFARDGNGSPAIGLGTEAAGLAAAYVRTGEQPVPIALAPGRLGAWTPGGFVEVDAELLPGVYQLDVPDEVMAPGATEALVTLSAPAVQFDPIDFTLVAYDPQDARALGLYQLQQSTRRDFLRRALPTFTDIDVALDRDEHPAILDAIEHQAVAVEETR